MTLKDSMLPAPLTGLSGRMYTFRCSQPFGARRAEAFISPLHAQLAVDEHVPNVRNWREGRPEIKVRKKSSGLISAISKGTTKGLGVSLMWVLQRKYCFGWDRENACEDAVMESFVWVIANKKDIRVIMLLLDAI